MVNQFKTIVLVLLTLLNFLLTSYSQLLHKILLWHLLFTISAFSDCLLQLWLRLLHSVIRYQAVRYHINKGRSRKFLTGRIFCCDMQRKNINGFIYIKNLLTGAAGRKRTFFQSILRQKQAFKIKLISFIISGENF